MAYGACHPRFKMDYELGEGMVCLKFQGSQFSGFSATCEGFW